MPVDPNRRKIVIAYESDDGQEYGVLTTLNHANAAGAVPATDVTPTYRKRWVPRHVNLLSTDLTGPDQKARLVIPTPTHPLWTGAAAGVTIEGLGDFVVTGRTGERRSRLGPTV